MSSSLAWRSELTGRVILLVAGWPVRTYLELTMDIDAFEARLNGLMVEFADH
jgi:hypothetical protein